MGAPPSPGSQRGEALLILLLCLCAALRVWLFAAAFPFFGNVDEAGHFDVVVRYSLGRVPRSLERMSPEATHFLARYASPEYLRPPEGYPGGKYPRPFWKLPPVAAHETVRTSEAAWSAIPNHEASQAPLYYALAGAWMRAGGLLGLRGARLLYWVRFLNVFLIAGVVLTSCVAARSILPERRAVRLGVPLLVAFLPQDAFYVIQNDALSPLCFGVAFVFLTRWLQPGVPGSAAAAIAGGAIAATALTKSTNLPLVGVALVVLAGCAWRSAASGTLRSALPKLAVFALSAGIPIAAWMAWNASVFGDPTGAAPKIRGLGWTLKPLAAWGEHPLFTWRGLSTFWSELAASFWRGELVWRGARSASAPLDVFYASSSAVLVGLGLASLASRQATPPLLRRTLGLAFLCFASLVALLATSSIAFDFGRCFYPSREHPYFSSGRLMSGALIPFLLLYVRGLDWSVGRKGNGWPPLLLLAGLALWITLSELAVARSVFASEYNWFHS